MNKRFKMSEPSQVLLFNDKNPLEENAIRVIYLDVKQHPLAYRDFKVSSTLISTSGLEETFTRKIAIDAIDNMAPGVIISLTRKITVCEQKILKSLEEKLALSGTKLLEIFYENREAGYTTSWRADDVVGVITSEDELSKSGKSLVSSFIEGTWNEGGELDNSIGKGIESQIKSTITSSYDFINEKDIEKVSRLLDEMSSYDVEHAVVAGFKGRRLVGLVEVAKGSINSAIVDALVVFKRVREMKADGFMLIHNHPSGTPTPSKEDILLTMRLSSASKVLGVNFIDSMIVGGKCLPTNVGGLQNIYKYKNEILSSAPKHPIKTERQQQVDKRKPISN